MGFFATKENSFKEFSHAQVHHVDCEHTLSLQDTGAMVGISGQRGEAATGPVPPDLRSIFMLLAK